VYVDKKGTMLKTKLCLQYKKRHLNANLFLGLAVFNNYIYPAYVARHTESPFKEQEVGMLCICFFLEMVTFIDAQTSFTSSQQITNL